MDYKIGLPDNEVPQKCILCQKPAREICPKCGVMCHSCGGLHRHIHKSNEHRTEMLGYDVFELPKKPSVNEADK